MSRTISFRPLLVFMEALLLRKDAQTLMLTGRHFESDPSLKWSRSWIDFFAASFVVDKSYEAMRNFCVLTSMEPVLIPSAAYCT